VERILNHISGTSLSPLAKIYNRHNYAAEMRAAMQRYEQRLAALLETAKPPAANGAAIEPAVIAPASFVDLCPQETATTASAPAERSSYISLYYRDAAE
jgi:hypothetical protein